MDKSNDYLPEKKSFHLHRWHQTRMNCVQEKKNYHLNDP